MTLVADSGLTAARLSDELGRRLDAAVAPSQRSRRVVGIEHEFAVFRGDDQLDFASMVHELGIPGARLHPTNRDLYLTASGSAVMADGLVAEIATPPLDIAPGFTRALHGSLAVTGRLLSSVLPDGDRLEGGSTHISVQVEHTAADRAAARFARTYAAPLMLLMDRAHSPGLLVRPRPGRLEVGGEYLTGRELSVASVFAAAAVATIERHVLTGDDGLPPLLDVTLEPARRRYGWYVDRGAFGSDLYADGRRSQLDLAAGGSVSAQRYLEYAWQMIRPTAAALVSKTELRLVDRVVDGSLPLPLETDTHELGVPAGRERAPRHPIGRALEVGDRPGFTVAPVSATWDWMAFRAGDDASGAVVVAPRESLASFLDELEAGRLDELIHSYRAVSPSDRVLRLDAQTERPGLHDDIEPGPALLPLDRYGIGTGPVSAIRPGKRLPPAEPNRSVEQSSVEQNLRTAPTTAVLLIGILALLVAAFGFHADAQARGDGGPDPRAQVVAIDVVQGPDGRLSLRVVFAEPWGPVPPREVFSLFFALTVDAGGQGTFLGWQTHDGVEESYSSAPAFILADGSVVFATDVVDPVGGVEVFVEYGSWQDETTTSAIFSSALFSIAPDDVRIGDFAASGGPVFDLVAGTPIDVAPDVTVDLPAVVGAEVAIDVSGDGTLADPVGDNQDYYGLSGPGQPDVASVTWQTVRFGEGLNDAARLARLGDVCGGALGPGTAAVCPDDLSVLASSGEWVWLDVQFSGPMTPLQAGMAWTEPGRPTFDGPEFDPNTGHNASLEVFTGPQGYEVGTTRFDGSFTSGPSDDVAAILRRDGVSLILSATALQNCTQPELFVVGPGGVDFVELPDPPASTVEVGILTVTTTTVVTSTTIQASTGSETTTTLAGSAAEPASSVTTTTDASGAPPTSLPTGVTDSGTSGLNPLWPILIGLGLLMIVIGVVYLRRPEEGMSVSIPVGFEKGNTDGAVPAVAG